MKKVLWLIVCLMTMVMSVNAQEETKPVRLTKTYKTTIRCEGAYLPCWGDERFSKTPCSVTIDFTYLGEYGSMLSLTLKNKGGESYNFLEDAEIWYMKEEDGFVYNIVDNLDNDVIMIYPTSKNVYRLVIYNESVLE